MFLCDRTKKLLLDYLMDCFINDKDYRYSESLSICIYDSEDHVRFDFKQPYDLRIDDDDKKNNEHREFCKATRTIWDFSDSDTHVDQTIIDIVLPLVRKCYPLTKAWPHGFGVCYSHCTEYLDNLIPFYTNPDHFKGVRLGYTMTIQDECMNNLIMDMFNMRRDRDITIHNAVDPFGLSSELAHIIIEFSEDRSFPCFYKPENTPFYRNMLLNFGLMIHSVNPELDPRQTPKRDYRSGMMVESDGSDKTKHTCKMPCSIL